MIATGLGPESPKLVSYAHHVSDACAMAGGTAPETAAKAPGAGNGGGRGRANPHRPGPVANQTQRLESLIPVKYITDTVMAPLHLRLAPAKCRRKLPGGADIAPLQTFGLLDSFSRRSTTARRRADLSM